MPLTLSRQELLSEYGSMLDAIAGSVRKEVGLDVDVRDLRSEGVVGLFEAADRFDESRKVPFGAFARHRVRGAMVDGARKNLSLSRRAREGARRNAVAYEVLEADAKVRRDEGARGPDRTAVAHGIGDLFGEIAAAMVLQAQAQQEGRSNPEEALLTELAHEEVRDAREMLPEKVRRVVHALIDEEKRQDEVAAELEMTREAVAKTYTRALHALRDKLRRDPRGDRDWGRAYPREET